jgi:hypothetical protein
MHDSRDKQSEQIIYFQHLERARTLLALRFQLSAKLVLDQVLPAPGLVLSRSQGVPDRRSRMHSTKTNSICW